MGSKRGFTSYKLLKIKNLLFIGFLLAFLNGGCEFLKNLRSTKLSTTMPAANLPAAKSPSAFPPPIPWKNYDWIGIIGNGQSLSVGGGGIPELAVNPVYPNLKLFDSSEVYDTTQPNASTLSVVQLKEPIRPVTDHLVGGRYPRNIWGETPNTAMAEQVSKLAEIDHRKIVSVHSVIGVSGMGIDFLLDSSNPNYPYPSSIYEIKALSALAKKAGKTFAYGAITMTHGERDGSNPDYEKSLVRMFELYNADIKAITGQTQDIPLIMSQQHTDPFYHLETDGTIKQPGFPHSTNAQWLASVHNPGKIILAGPKYQYEYWGDGVHMPTISYEMTGEKYAQAYYQTMEKGKPWVPLQPKALEWTAGTNTITVSFDIPTPPLQWDANLTTHQTVNTYWKNGRGFEVLGPDKNPISITSAELVNTSTAVRLTLGSTPTSGPLTVQYAMTLDGSKPETAYTGTELGRRGQLRDSDPFVGFTTGRAQPNYCVSFILETK